MPATNELLQEGSYRVNQSPPGAANLYEVLTRLSTPFSVSEVTAWADHLLETLESLHNRKPAVVYGCIRPQNLMLDGSGKVELLGANSDRRSCVDRAGDGETDLRYLPLEEIWPGLDPASQKVITNSYDERSERILKEPLDARSDIYSLGATLYFLVTGREPVDALERSIEILEGRLDPLREPTKIAPSIPAEVSDVVMKAMEIKRENRYDSAFIMRQVLRSALERVLERDEQETSERQEAAKVTRLESLAGSMIHQPAIETNEHAYALIDSEPPTETTEDLLEVPERAHVEPSAEVLAYREAQHEIDDDELAAVLRELEEVELQAQAALSLNQGVNPKVAEAVPPVAEFGDIDVADVELNTEEGTTADSHASADNGPTPVAVHVANNEVQVIEEVVDLPKKVFATSASSEAVEPIFSISVEPEVSRLPLPAIVGAIGLLAMIGVGIWFAMSSSSSSPQAPIAQPARVVESVPVIQPSPEVIASSTNLQTDAAVANDMPVAVEDSNVARPSGPRPRAKKLEGAKPRQEKKKVTVDDLINDNQ